MARRGPTRTQPRDPKVSLERRFGEGHFGVLLRAADLGKLLGKSVVAERQRRADAVKLVEDIRRKYARWPGVVAAAERELIPQGHVPAPPSTQSEDPEGQLPPDLAAHTRELSALGRAGKTLATVMGPEAQDQLSRVHGQLQAALAAVSAWEVRERGRLAAASKLGLSPAAANALTSKERGDLAALVAQVKLALATLAPPALSDFDAKAWAAYILGRHEEGGAAAERRAAVELRLKLLYGLVVSDHDQVFLTTESVEPDSFAATIVTVAVAENLREVTAADLRDLAVVSGLERGAKGDDGERRQYDAWRGRHDRVSERFRVINLELTGLAQQGHARKPPKYKPVSPARKRRGRPPGKKRGT